LPEIGLPLRGGSSIALLSSSCSVFHLKLDGTSMTNLDSPGKSGVRGALTVDLAPLHAKIGQLALENDFLEGALTKSGLLSAKR
jgi:hypothetical protein